MLVALQTDVMLECQSGTQKKKIKPFLTGVAGEISFLLKWNAAFNVELQHSKMYRGALAASETPKWNKMCFVNTAKAL